MVMSGFHPSWSIFISCSIPLADVLATTNPGVSQDSLKWWKVFMFLTFRKCGFRKAAQSWMGTIGWPFWSPASWTKFALADCSTTVWRSFKQPTLVFLTRCFSRPKHQSGANFVWTTSMKESCTSLCSPTNTRHIGTINKQYQCVYNSNNE